MQFWIDFQYNINHLVLKLIYILSYMVTYRKVTEILAVATLRPLMGFVRRVAMSARVDTFSDDDSPFDIDYHCV